MKAWTVLDYEEGRSYFFHDEAKAYRKAGRLLDSYAGEEDQAHVYIIEVDPYGEIKLIKEW